MRTRKNKIKKGQLRYCFFYFGEEGMVGECCRVKEVYDDDYALVSYLLQNTATTEEIVEKDSLFRTSVEAWKYYQKSDEYLEGLEEEDFVHY